MRYSRTHVREALHAAQRDGKPTNGLKVGDREAEIVLERMGYLPVDEDAVDKRIQDWYVAQGLVLREGLPDAPVDTPDDTPNDTPEAVTPVRSGSSNGAALDAAEAALQAAHAALRLARSLSAS